MRNRNLFSASEAKTTIAIQWNVQKLDSAQVASEEFSGNLPYSCKRRQRVSVRQMVEALQHGKDGLGFCPC